MENVAARLEKQYPGQVGVMAARYPNFRIFEFHPLCALLALNRSSVDTCFASQPARLENMGKDDRSAADSGDEGRPGMAHQPGVFGGIFAK